VFQPIVTRILKEDLGKDVPQWVDKIIYQLNLITDYLKTAFAKQITIQDNLINNIRTLTVNATGIPTSDGVTFLVTLPQGYQPIGIQIISCIDRSGVPVGNAVWAEFQAGLQNSNVVVRAIYGLTAGHSYNITFLVY
jgi:hypothetical protein